MASYDYALKVVGEIKAWYDKDNYKQTRTFPKFHVDYDSPPAGNLPSGLYGWNRTALSKIRPLIDFL